MADDNNQGGQSGDDGGNSGEDELTYDGWFNEQDDAVKGLISGNVTGLKSALDTERSQRKEMAKALKATTKELEKGTDARNALEKITVQLDAAEKRLAFVESVSGQVSNVTLAWLAAQEIGAVDGTGAVNLETLKASYPELFVKKVRPAGNAGDGAGSSVAGKKDMNTFIRRSAGR